MAQAPLGVNLFPPATSTPAELFAALKAYRDALSASQMRCDMIRRENDVLKDKVDQLERQVKLLSESNSSGSGRGRARTRKLGRAMSSMDADHVLTLQAFARQFTVMVHPWLDAQWYQIDPMSLSLSALTDAKAVVANAFVGARLDAEQPATRADYADALQIHVMGEFYRMLPAVFREKNRVQLTTFAQVFGEASSQQKSNNVHACRNVAHRIWKDVDQDWFMSKRSMNDPVVRAVLGPYHERNGKGRFSRFPPLFYPDRKKVDNVNQLFLNRELPRLLCFILFSNSGLSGKKVTKSTTGKLWGIKKLTPGAIAYTLILARHLFSPDSVFGESAEYIPYMADFNIYRSLLECETPATQEVFKLWTPIVFGGTPSESDHEYIDIGGGSDEHSSAEDYAQHFRGAPVSQSIANSGNGNADADISDAAPEHARTPGVQTSTDSALPVAQATTSLATLDLASEPVLTSTLIPESKSRMLRDPAAKVRKKTFRSQCRDGPGGDGAEDVEQRMLHQLWNGLGEVNAHSELVR
ncbi:hypothetical protein CERSUDRAFT_93901 [Gelatoporia subvermispora B]|uniref:Uncharacterized protein n=1 Tax=Ceriporiopsis subvermispora (strain B) TaxID=914234 RepID=M2RIS5_CERS8|nr:hypothetical protein CERSUDRAFT_93901 [Gelatoporia subvermispora B]